MAIGDAFSAPIGVKNQMVGQPQRMPSGVPGYDAGYAQAPGQPRLPAEPYPIGRPTGVVGGPAYYTPPGFQAPPQPTQAFMPLDVRPDPIGQQFMRQYQSPMGQQFIDQYEATQAPIRAREAELREAERARQDQRFQEMMDRIAELEGQLTAREEAATIPQPEIPVFDPDNPLGIDLSGLPDFSQIDFSGIPDFLKNLNIPGITDRPMEGTGREEEPMDRFDPRDTRFAIDSVTGKVIPEEDVILTTMPVPDPKGYVRRTLPLPPPASRTDPGAILDSERRLNEQYGSNLKNLISPMPQMTAPAPTSGEGVTTDRIPEGMRFMGQPLIPTSTPPRKGSFLSAVARPDLPPPNISGPFGFIRSKPSIDSMPSPISIPSLPISRTERPMPSMPAIPKIDLSRISKLSNIR